MRQARFQATLVSGHKDDAVEVPFDPGERWSIAIQPLWSGRRGYPVDATLNGTAFESAIVPRCSRYWLLVPESVERVTHTATGDSASITVVPNNAFKPHPFRGVE